MWLLVEGVVAEQKKKEDEAEADEAGSRRAARESPKNDNNSNKLYRQRLISVAWRGGGWCVGCLRGSLQNWRERESNLAHRHVNIHVNEYPQMDE